MFSKVLITSLLSLIPLIGYSANIVINPITGFTDATVVSPIGGNPGTTLGAQRLNTFQKAADILETFLDVKIDIKVDAAFSALTCGPGSGVLGSAGATNGKINFANAPAANTIYPMALANNLANSDLNSTTAEINATFNSSMDNNDNCLTGVDWYYGYDDPSTAGAGYTNDMSFLSVVIHELLHGLGVSSWVYSNGALNSGFMDAYSANLYDQTSAKSWTSMNDSERLASMTNSNNLVWTGSNVNTSAAALALTDGINASKVEMYAPSPYEGGSSVSHFSKDATPNEIMEPSYTEFLTTPGMATQLLQDMGWALATGNTAPVLAAIGAQSSDEDNAKIINLIATDGEGDTLTYSATSDNLSITASVSGSTLTLTPAAEYFGNANITVTVSDGALSDNEVVSYSVNSVNDLPVFTSSASGSVQYGNSLDINLTATDIETANNSISFSVTSSNASQVSTSFSGSTLTLTPVNNYVGMSNLTIRATDGNSGIKDQSYSLTITAIPNTAPVLTSIGAQSSNEDNAKVINLSATDGEGDSLTYSASSDNASITTSISGSTLTLTPANDYFGNANITVTVSDGALSDNEVVSYSVNSVNDLPVFTSSDSGSVQYGNNLNVSLTATDIETANNSISFTVLSANASQVSTSVSGSTLTLTPVNDYIGTSNLTIRATDGDGGIKDQSYSLTITAIPNTAPALTFIGAQSSDEDNSKVINLSATDNEGDSLTYTASSNNVSVTAAITGSTLTLTPAADYFGDADITVTVSDGFLSDNEVVSYSVNSVNDLPVFASADSVSMQYGNSLDISLAATDIETTNNNMVFSLTNVNTSQVSASISGSTLTLTPVNDYVGISNLTLRATDTNSGTTDQSFTLTILAASNTAPVLSTIGTLASDEDNVKVINLTATDAEGDALTYSASSDNPSIATSISGSTLTLTPATDYFGSANITITVSDSILSATEVVSFNVNSVNDLPVFTSPTSGSVQYGNSLNVNLTASDIETENNSITYSIFNADTNQVNASISGTTLALTPINDYVGSTNLIIRATDGHSGTTDLNYSLTITAPANTAPSFTNSGNYSSLYSALLNIELLAIDGENDALTFNLVNSNASQVNATLNGSLLTVSGINEYLGASTITVSVSDGQEIINQEIHILILEDFSLSSADKNLFDGETNAIDLDTFSFSLAGGNNEHTVSINYDGQAVEASLLTEVNGTYQLAMPTEGAFAGSYEVTVSDSNGETASFTLERPLRLSSNINQLVSSSELQELFIEGAPAGSIIDLHVSQVDNDLTLQVNDQIITQVTSSDNAELFNRAAVQLKLLDISETSNATISAEGLGLPLGSHTVQLLPLNTLALNITDSALMAVTANIMIDDDRFLTWGLAQQHETNINGEASFSLPLDQTTSLTVSAEHYQAKTMEVAVGTSQLAIELELLENPMTVSGTVTTSTLNFETETPSVQLVATDGAIVLAGLTNISSTSVNYSITVNKYKFNPDQLSVSHGDVRQDISLSGTNDDATINIEIDQLQLVNSGDQGSEPVEDVVDVNPAAGNGFALFLSALILLLFRKQRTD